METTTEMLNIGEIPEDTGGVAGESAAETAVSAETEAENETLRGEIARLNGALEEVNIRLELLMAGAAKERLAEGVKLAEGLCSAGQTPAEAAEEIIREYPHLKAVQRDIPQIAAQSGGIGDGFDAVRNIFAVRGRR